MIAGVERSVPDPSRPAGALQPAQDLRGLLFSRAWIVIGSIGLVLVTGVGTLMPSEGVEWSTWASAGTDWRAFAGPAKLFAIYGVGFVLAWPAVFLLGLFRRSVDDATAARFPSYAEGRRSRVQLTLMATAFVGVAAGWAAALVHLTRSWPSASETAGRFVSCGLLLATAFLLGRAAVGLARRGNRVT